MSDQIVINVIQEAPINLGINDTGENINLNPLTLNQGVINHSVTHQSGASDELLHNLLGGLNGGQSGQYYHLSSGQYFNLVTGSVVRPSETGNFITTSQTGAFYPLSNPSGFITGVDLSGYVTGDVVRPSQTGNFITTSQTGAFYPRSNPSGFITGVDLSNYVTGAVVRPSETGSFVTASQTGDFYPSSNPSGFITGVDLSGYITGDVVRPSQTGNFVTISQTGDFYAASNPSGFITGMDLSAYVTGQVVRPSETGNFITTSQTGGFYAASNPSGFITGVDLSSYATKAYVTGASGSLQIQINSLNGQTGSYVLASQTGNFITVDQTGAFYPRSNPSGFITGVDLSNYSTISYTTGISGSLQLQINNLASQTGSYVLKNQTGDFITSSQTGAFYPASNPSGFITGIPDIVYTTGNQDISGLKDFQTRPTVTDIPVLISGDPVDIIHLYGKNDQGQTIYKGQPVYINGANGANPLISLASNTGERTSSKTIGLLAQDLAINEFGYIITEGTLEGFNTSSGAAGDPMWLGTGGNIIYGTGNKPYGNNHLVYLGIVLRSSSNNGKVYIKVQNGFEIEELHNVYAKNAQNKDSLIYNSASGAWIARQINTEDVSGLSNYVTGVSGYLQNQISDLNNATGSYATINYVSGISGNLQNQLDDLSVKAIAYAIALG